MQISVVVLTFNSARTVARCLDSLAAQHSPPAEIIVVDDDSTDSTRDLVATFQQRSPVPVRLLRNGSHNISRGRNLGMAAAGTPVVAFLDSDAWAEPGWLRHLAVAFAGGDVAVVGGGVVTAHASVFAEAIALNDATVRRLATSGELLVGGCNMAVHLDRVAGERFDERWVHAEDIEFVDRVERRAPWAVAPDAVVWHESRSTPGGYLRQMYRYGLWKMRYTRRTGKVRAVDYVPSAVLLASAALAVPVSPMTLLALPALSLAETLFVLAYRRAAVRLWPLMLLGWLVKNTGWGAGVLVALGQQLTFRSQVPPASAPVAG